MKEIINQLVSILDSKYILENEPLKNHTSFKVGGPVNLLLMPQTLEGFQGCLKISRESEFPVYILGNGSNLLVKDNGVHGIMIKTLALQKLKISETTMHAEPGISLKDLADKALEHHLTGLEFASGIPGSLGGAVYMNAGAYDGEMKNVISSIEVLTPSGEIKTIPKEACGFGYRKSILQGSENVLVGINLSLSKGNYNEIKEKMEDFNQRRRDKQPLEYPSAGSTFRRPEGYFAGKLVEDAGFKGFSIGGAQVSEKHSGFVINKNNATAQDILNLIETIQKEVKDQFGVDLHREVIVIGES
ncbi:MAG: UDP-N-acetylmuramate dehydrogenase [Eubacteriaceae bacterium]